MLVCNPGTKMYTRQQKSWSTTQTLTDDIIEWTELTINEAAGSTEDRDCWRGILRTANPSLGGHLRFTAFRLECNQMLIEFKLQNYELMNSLHYEDQRNSPSPHLWLFPPNDGQQQSNYYLREMMKIPWINYCIILVIYETGGKKAVKLWLMRDKHWARMRPQHYVFKNCMVRSITVSLMVTKVQMAVTR